MENLRIVLVCLAALSGFMLYQAWQSDYATPSSQTASNTSGNAATDNSSNPNATHAAPASESGAASGRSNKAHSERGPGSGADKSDQSKSPGSIAAGEQTGHGKLVEVVTDKYRLWIDTRGGDLFKVKLRDVPVSSDKPDTPFTLIQSKPGDFFRQTSRIVAAGDKQPAPRQFEADKSDYRLSKDKDALSVTLTWAGDNGRRIRKTYRFKRGSYQIRVKNTVDNAAQGAWTVSNYVRFWRTTGQASNHPWFIPSTFAGVGWYQQKADKSGFNYRSRKSDALAKNPLDLTQKGGWIALIRHYFIAAAIPEQKTAARFFATQKATSQAPTAYAAGFRTAQTRLAPNASTTFVTKLFLGPKLQNQLGSAAGGLSLTVDYGFMTVLAKPIFHVLSFLHAVVGNWGVAIILLTVIIKLLFYKLSEKQYRAMARMRKFQPRMQQLKEQYGDDRQQLQAKMMELYKKEGFNPLAGCWPMLIQAPVFIVLYWVLLESAEMRAEPFLWINDLSSPDPYFILPVFFGVTMFLQQRMTMTTAMDPIQQRLMQIMPVGLAIFFTFFPAGLVLYWCTNNSLSIAQQWYIYKKLDSEGLGHKAQSS